MAKAIKEKCMDCVGGQREEVRKCQLTKCPLFPYHFGCNPNTYINRHKDNVKIVP